MRIRTFLLGSWLVLASSCLNAQFQLEWIFEKEYNWGYGAPVSCQSDQLGGVFLSSRTQDTACAYAMGDVIHVGPTGYISWENSLYDETPCLTQNLYYFNVVDTRMYYAVSDTAGWIVKLDTTGAEVWKVDTTVSIFPDDMDRYENITAYSGQQVICYDSSGQRLWNYTTPYAYTHQISRIISDKNGNRNVFFNYNDGSQTETRGVGILQLDSNGLFRWDTAINQQTNPDSDLLVDVKMDNMNNSFVLSQDMFAFGSYVTRVDENGNIVAGNQFVSTPTFLASQLEIDTLHGLVYVAGRTSNYTIILKYDMQLNALDTMFFDPQYVSTNVIGINSYGFLYHLWVTDSATLELRLELYNHLGSLQDVYTYWDSTRFAWIYPESLEFDSIGNIFAVCLGRDTAANSNDVGLVFKFNNPLGVLENDHANYAMTIFPNPAKDNVSVSVPSNNGAGRCDLYSISGQLISTVAFYGNSFVLNTEQLPSGIYLVEVVSESGNRSTQKLIIQHP